MSIPDPITAPDAWDKLVIGGVEFRGGFEFDGELLKRKLDRRHSAGRDGARVRDRGYDLAKIKLSLSLWEPEHFSDLEALTRLLFPRDADVTRRAAYACAHPALALAGISEVYGEAAGALKQTSPGLWSVTLDLVEYRPDAQQRAGRSRAVAARPDLGANATAFTGTEPAPPAAATPPSASGAADPD